MILVTTPFNGGNYLIWSRLIRISLGAKMKLGFIDSKIPKPEKDSDEFGQWYRVDCMVRCWILNSMSKDIFELFVYANSARELWLELEGRFGQCSWLVLYQLQREIFTISQGNLSLFWPILQRLRDYGTNSHASCPYRTAPAALLRLWRN
ncbi:UNVERIFIED_CONTAM: hypothetical protein Sangu_0282800 [Sesamum angustifolium]|uniref:Retrotransposon Copia-like N-terminal domain-containing protein n=1 Tax=Sesamum angustifolium TaxID=2727405 RepID=A0AAW2QQ60_9LAMI